MNSIAEVKEILFNMLEAAVPNTDIQATQQMGVNLSNSVNRKEGVVIVQMQSVEVYGKIVPMMTKALRLCDVLLLEQPLPVKQLLPVAVDMTEDNDPIEDCCAWLYENSIGWEDMQDLMKARYAEFVIDKKGTKIEAAKLLKIQPSYLSKITSLLSIKNKTKEGEIKNENKKMAII